MCVCARTHTQSISYPLAYIASDCFSVAVFVGTAVGSIIGGVLLTAAIAGVVVVAVVYKVKWELIATAG